MSQVAFCIFRNGHLQSRAYLILHFQAYSTPLLWFSLFLFIIRFQAPSKWIKIFLKSLFFNMNSRVKEIIRQSHHTFRFLCRIFIDRS